jgi:hypothetical protein
MIKHCEAEECYITLDQLSMVIGYNDKEKLFTMEYQAQRPRKFRCPVAVCGTEYDKFGALTDHLHDAVCGDVVRKSEGDGLDYLKTYLL